MVKTNKAKKTTKLRPSKKDKHAKLISFIKKLWNKKEIKKDHELMLDKIDSTLRNETEKISAKTLFRKMLINHDLSSGIEYSDTQI